MPLTFPWKTPVGDGEVLIDPPCAEVMGMLKAGSGFPRDLEIGGMPAGELRDMTRLWLGSRLDIDPAMPIVATGHQCEFHHPGVWFKDLLVSRLADRVGGAALHFAADLDTLAHRELIIPRVDGDQIVRGRVGITDAPDGYSPAFINSPPQSVVDAIDAEVESASLAGKLYWLWRAAAVADCSGTLAGWLTSGREAVNAALGLDSQTVMFSDLVRSEPFARFAAALILGGERLFALHGRLLASHREAYGIANATRPVPDLVRGPEGAFELPLWLLRKNRPRCRLMVRYKADAVEFLADHECVAVSGRRASQLVRAIRDAAQAADGWIVAPRALTLTMFLRLLAVDIFIHGTGGARYDVVGDELARSFFGIAPPRYVTATATLRLKLPRREADDEQLARAVQRLHHWRHNPLDAAGEAQRRALAALPAEIERAERFSERRRRLFAEMHALKRELREKAAPTQVALEAEIDRLRADMEHNAWAKDREYFFALFDRNSLLGLADGIEQWMTA